MLRSLFRPPPSDSRAKENGLAMFGSIHEFGDAWAEAGSQLALMRADTPSISNIQACEVLCLYWFAVGQLDRAAIHYSKIFRSTGISSIKIYLKDST